MSVKIVSKTKKKIILQVEVDLSGSMLEMEDSILSVCNQVSFILQTMNIAGVTEATCKTLVKHRLCAFGMRWKDRGIKTVMNLRSLVLTKDRWKQFWEEILQYGTSNVQIGTL